MGPCLLLGKISTTCNTAVLENDKKNKYIFVKNNLSCTGVNTMATDHLGIQGARASVAKVFFHFPFSCEKC